MSDTGRVTAADAAEARWNWLTVAEVAERLGKSPGHVRGLIADGALTATDMRRTGAKRPDWQIRPEWLDAFIERRTQDAA